MSDTNVTGVESGLQPQQVKGGLAGDPARSPSPADSVRAQRTILGHPAGLFVLFFTEMWERFSYYGMRSLLVLYMVNYLIHRIHAGTSHVFGFMVLQHSIEAVFGPMKVQPLASQIYGIYTGLVYFTPFFGGILADRVLGQRKTVVLGGVLTRSEVSIPPGTRDATAPTPSFTWASTWALSFLRWSAERLDNCLAGTTALPPPAWEW